MNSAKKNARLPHSQNYKDILILDPLHLKEFETTSIFSIV